MSYAFQGNALQTARTLALSTSQVVKASEGLLRLFSGRLDSTAPSATYYFQVYNSATVPVDGALSLNTANLLLVAPTKIVHTSGTDNSILLDFTDALMYASSGISWALSSTEFTKTLSGAYVSGTTLFL